MKEEMRAALVRLLPRLQRFGVALTDSAADADELVQDACERAMRHAEQLRHVSRLDAWIYGIMRNCWTDEVRWQRLRRHDRLDAANEVEGEDGQRSADARMTLAAVRRALAALPADRRAVLTLVCVDGLSYRETAEVLGIPIGTVMSRLARARKELHDALVERGVAEGATVHPLDARHRRHTLVGKDQ